MNETSDEIVNLPCDATDLAVGEAIRGMRSMYRLPTFEESADLIEELASGCRQKDPARYERMMSRVADLRAHKSTAVAIPMTQTLEPTKPRLVRY